MTPAEKRRQEEEKKKKLAEEQRNRATNKLITEEATLASFGFESTYDSSND